MKTMVSKISVVIPAYHEDDAIIERCMNSVLTASKNCPCPVEIVLAINVVGAGKAKNTGAQYATGDVLVFLDADSTISSGYLKEVYEKASNPDNIGGGTKWVIMSKYSLGVILCLIPGAIILYWYGVTVGTLWVKREYFDELKGFILDAPKTYRREDLDFAIRLKQLAKLYGKNFRSIKRSYMIWDTRSFDKYGQWFWLKAYRIFKE